MGKVSLELSMLCLTVLLASALIADCTLRVDAQPIQKMPKWSIPDEVYDLAVSADGSIVAVATGEGLKVYGSQGNLIWSFCRENIVSTAVDVSDDGNVVVTAIVNSTQTQTTYHVLFWKNAKTLSGTPRPDWSSINLFGEIGPEALAVSSDGNQVVVVGTGPNVYYWNNSLTLTGESKNPIWHDFLGGYLEHVDISDDGDIIAILGRNSTNWEPFAFVYKDSKTRAGPQSEGYDLTYTFGTGDGLDMALSDSGSYMVVGAYIAAGLWEGRVYYFNTSMSANWAPQWIWRLALNEHAWAVDISDNGDTVAVATNWWETQPNYKPCLLGIVHGASTMRGTFNGLFDKNFANAEDYTDHQYRDVSIDG
ncbi:MAG: WD40 repeat domain-containing protein, partial [Thermoproteota archaeon]